MPLNPKKIAKDKSFRKEKLGGLLPECVSSSSEEDENLVSVMDSLQKKQTTFFKDELMRRREFVRQKQILRMVEGFLTKTSSNVKQRGLSDNYEMYLKSFHYTKKSENENSNLQETMEDNLIKYEQKSGLEEKNLEKAKRKQKAFSEERVSGEERKMWEEQRRPVFKAKKNNFVVIFAHSKKKSKERMKVKIF